MSVVGVRVVYDDRFHWNNDGIRVSFADARVVYDDAFHWNNDCIRVYTYDARPCVRPGA